MNRGRDARYRAPPAQNRTCGIPAYGSHLGCLTAKRCSGQGSKSNLAKVTYQIIDTATNTVVFEKELESKDLGAHSDQLTVEKTLSIAGLQPGKYKVTIKVNDEISKQEIAQSAPFVVE